MQDCHEYLIKLIKTYIRCTKGVDIHRIKKWIRDCFSRHIAYEIINRLERYGEDSLVMAIYDTIICRSNYTTDINTVRAIIHNESSLSLFFDI